jgi:hypothetical protein
MFRRVTIEADAIDDDGPLPVDRHMLGKTYEDEVPDSTRGRRLVADTRLFPDAGELTIDLSLEGAEQLPVRWRVVYQRLDRASPSADPELFGETVLAAGLFAAR